MRSETTAEFWDWYRKLPPDIKKEARAAYRLFVNNPNHPSLRFKPVSDSNPPIYSVRIAQGYRAVGVLDPDDVITWDFIGKHDEYLRQLRRRG